MHTSVSVRLAAGAMLLALTGCATVGSGSRTVGHYLGYVRVVEPAQGDGVRLEEVTTLGGWVETGAAQGAGLGIRRTARATTSSEACGLTILVSDPRQLAAVETLIKTYAEGQACVIQRRPGP